MAWLRRDGILLLAAVAVLAYAASGAHVRVRTPHSVFALEVALSGVSLTVANLPAGRF